MSAHEKRAVTRRDPARRDGTTHGRPVRFIPPPPMTRGNLQTRSPSRSTRLRVRCGQRSVQIDRHPGRCAGLLRDVRASRRVSANQNLDHVGCPGDLVAHPERCGVRRHRTEQRCLIATTARRSDRRSPPPASITARSRITRPGSWPARRSRSPESSRESALVRPTRSAIPASRPLPACDTKPAPSAETSTFIKRPSRVTFKVIRQSQNFRPREPEESLPWRTTQRPRTPGPLPVDARSGLGGSGMFARCRGLRATDSWPVGRFGFR